MPRLYPPLITLLFCLSACSGSGSGSAGSIPTIPGSSTNPTSNNGGAAPAVPIFTPQSSNWQTDALGYTLIESFQNAPYPHSSRSFTDDRVMLFVPQGFRITQDLDILVHFHGHGAEIVATDQQHHYREQLQLAARNAILVLPQGPLRASDSGIGKLQDSDGLKNLLGEVLSVLKREQVSPSSASIRHIALSGHSGGYYAISQCLSKGGMDSQIKEVYLHDALYGQSSVFEAWARVAGHKLVSSYQGSGSTRSNNLSLASALQSAGVRVATSLSDRDLTGDGAVIVGLEHAHNEIVRARHLLAQMLRHSILPGLGAAVPELRSVEQSQGLITLRWSSINNKAARGLRIYHGPDGQNFSMLTDESYLGPQSTEYNFSTTATQDFFYLVSVDELGQESKPSNVYGWGAGPRPVLIVDGFHRSHGSSLNDPQHSLAVLHGLAIANSGHGFASCSAKSVSDGDVLLSRFVTVDWLVGDQSTLDQSLNGGEQSALESYLQGGGAMLISGSEIAYDLSRGNSSDKAFLKNVLHAAYAGDNAGSLTVTGQANLSGLSANFGGSGAAYKEDFPDYVNLQTGAQTILLYSNQRIAGLFYAGSFGSSGANSAVAYLAFPFETIEDSNSRLQVMSKILAEFDTVHNQAGR
jgi:hypothetical protein